MNEHHTGVPQITSITIAGIVNMLTSDPFNLSQKYEIVPALGVSESTISRWINQNVPSRKIRKNSYRDFFTQLEQWCEYAGVNYCEQLCLSFPELKSYVSTSASFSNRKTMIDILIKNSLEHHYQELYKQKNKNVLTEEFPVFSDDSPATINATTNTDPTPVYELGGTLISRGASKGAFWVREPARNREYLVTPQNTLPPNMSALPTYVPGSRANTIEAIKKSLEAGEHTFLNGLPGQGKTQTAIRAAMEMNPDKGAYLINYTLPENPQYEAMEETVLQIPFTGYQYMPSRSEMTMQELRQEDFNNRLGILTSQYNKNAIFIIDNFDGKPLDQLLGEKSLKALLGCGVHFIFTTRHSCVDWRPSWKIEPMTTEEQMVLIQTFCGETCTEEELRPLLSAVGGNTLLIVLMGKTLNSNRELTPKILLEHLKKHTLSKLDSKVSHEWHGNDSDNGFYKKEQLYAHIRALFDISQFTVTEKTVLVHAILLPDSGMEYTLFESCLEKDAADTLSYLLKCGWLSLQEETNLLQIHPAVREVFIEELKPQDEDCNVFLSNLYKTYDSKVYYTEKYQHAAECFANASYTLSDFNGNWANYAGEFYNHLRNHQNALVFLKKAQKIRCEKLSDSDPFVAISYRNIGRTYYGLGAYKDAIIYLETALDMLKKNPSANQSDLALTYILFGRVYGSSLGDYRTSLDFYKKAKECYQTDLSADDLSLAMAERYFGRAYIGLGKYSESLTHLDAAKTIQERILPKDHPITAITYAYIGRANMGLGDYKTALIFLKNARNIQENKLPRNHPDLAFTYHNIGCAYGNLYDYEKAFAFLEKSRAMKEIVLSSNHSYIASTIDSIGCAYANTENYPEALSAFESARIIQENSLPEKHPDLAVTYTHLGYTYGDMGNYGKAVEFLEKARVVKQTILPENYLHLTISYNIGKPHSFSGNYEKSLVFLKTAQAMGYTTGTYNLGRMYLYGHGVAKDLNKAIEFFVDASNRAQQSDAKSCFHLGLIYLGVHPQAQDFEGVDPIQAWCYLERAKELGAADVDDFIQQAKSLIGEEAVPKN